MPLPSDFTDAQPAMAASATASGSDEKAIIVVYLGGGIDCHNFITPRTGGNRTAYDAARATASIADNSATAINTDLQFHPSLTGVKTMYDAGKVALAANIGPLAYPMTKTEYNNGSVEKPAQLFSHSDQSGLWQTGIADFAASPTGWVGRLTDLIAPAFNVGSTIAPGFTFNGLQIAHNSHVERTLGAKSTGLAERLAGFRVSAAAQALFDTVTSDSYTNPMMAEVASAHTRAEAATATVNSAIAETTPSTTFPAGPLGAKLKTAVQLAAGASTLGHRRTVHWIVDGGYDHHAELLAELTAKLDGLDDALKAAYDCTVELGISNNVVFLVYSEFGRSLLQNGSGTDHAWGGHAMVIGGGVTGGIYGTYPDLSLAGNNMVDARGYLLPTLPVETLYATLAAWFGVPDATSNGVNPMDLIFPNLGRFGTRDLGFL